MKRVHNLTEITRAFESLRESLKNGKRGKGANERLFNDIDLSIYQALTLAWLMNHKDTVYPLQLMSQELHLKKLHLKQILNNLYAMGYLENNGDSMDVTDGLYFQIIDMQACKASGISGRYGNWDREISDTKSKADKEDYDVFDVLYDDEP